MGLDSVELIMAYEAEFDISISNDSATVIVTPRDAGDVIEAALAMTRRPLQREEITIEQLSLDEKIYTLDSRYIGDFRVD